MATKGIGLRTSGRIRSLKFVHGFEDDQQAKDWMDFSGAYQNALKDGMGYEVGQTVIAEAVTLDEMLSENGRTCEEFDQYHAEKNAERAAKAAKEQREREERAAALAEEKRQKKIRLRAEELEREQDAKRKRDLLAKATAEIDGTKRKS